MKRHSNININSLPWRFDVADAESLLQSIGGFLFVVTNDYDVFFVSASVEQYLGFNQCDMIHQNALHFIHSEDRQLFTSQLQTTAKHRSQRWTVARGIKVRFRCLLNNTSGFITLEMNGQLRTLVGQNPSTGTDKQALFAVCCPCHAVPPTASHNDNGVVFKTTHRLDLTLRSIDHRGKEIFDNSDIEIWSKRGYDLVHPADLHYYATAHQHLLTRGSAELVAYRQLSNHQRCIWLQSNATLVYKNSRPDFISVFHCLLSHDDGEALCSKRGRGFQFPLSITLPSWNKFNTSCDSTMVLDHSDSPVADVHCPQSRHQLVTPSPVAGDTLLTAPTCAGTTFRNGRCGRCLNEYPQTADEPKEYVDDVSWYLTPRNSDEQAWSRYSSNLQNQLTTDGRWLRISPVDSSSVADHTVTSGNMAAGSDVSSIATLSDGSGLPIRSSNTLNNDVTTTTRRPSLYTTICNDSSRYNQLMQTLSERYIDTVDQRSLRMTTY